MKDLKTYFFIAGVAHEGEDKEWVKAEDVLKMLDEVEKETSDTLAEGMKKIDKAIDRLTDEVNKAAARIIEADKEIKSLKIIREKTANLCTKYIYDIARKDEEILELKADHSMFIDFIKRTFGKDAPGILEDLRDLEKMQNPEYFKKNV